MHAAPQALETHERESHSHWRDEGEHGGHQPVGERHGVVSSGEAAAAVYNIAGAFHAREGGEESEVEHFAFVLAFGTEEKFPGPGGRPRKTIPGDRGGGTETPAARHKVQARHARYSEIRNP